MATADTEVTFIRCPNCRSLLPAVAPRCKMCGHVLGEASEKKSEKAELEPQEEKSRVRKRSGTFLPPDNLDHEAEASTSAKDSAAQSKNFQLDDSAKADSPEVDKSSEFKDTDPGEASDQEMGITKGRGSQMIPRSVIDSAITRDLGKVENPPQDLESRPESRSVNGRDDFAGNSQEESSEDRPKRKRRKRKRKRVDSPQEFGDREGGGDEEFSDEDESSRAGSSAIIAGADKDSRAEVSRNNKEGFAMEETKSNSENREPRNFDANRGRTGRGDNRRNEQTRRPQPQRSIGREPETDLVAWLVNFENPHGKAIEIREGRFFITSEMVKETDLVVSDKSISTPHCLVKASLKDGLKIQDLMSDSGTFIRKPGEEDYKPIEEARLVDHGDYLKVGEYEVLVCVVPKPKKKKASKAVEKAAKEAVDKVAEKTVSVKGKEKVAEKIPEKEVTKEKNEKVEEK